MSKIWNEINVNNKQFKLNEKFLGTSQFLYISYNFVTSKNMLLEVFKK